MHNFICIVMWAGGSFACEPHSNLFWASYITPREMVINVMIAVTDDDHIVTDGPTCWYCVRIYNLKYIQQFKSFKTYKEALGTLSSIYSLSYSMELLRHVHTSWPVGAISCINQIAAQVITYLQSDGVGLFTSGIEGVMSCCNVVQVDDFSCSCCRAAMSRGLQSLYWIWDRCRSP